MGFRSRRRRFRKSSACIAPCSRSSSYSRSSCRRRAHTMDMSSAIAPTPVRRRPSAQHLREPSRGLASASRSPVVTLGGASALPPTFGFPNVGTSQPTSLLRSVGRLVQTDGNRLFGSHHWFRVGRDRRYDLHHGFGALGHCIPSHRNGTASPSATKMSPTSRPFALSRPQVRANMQTHLPSVVAGHEQVTGE
jgi:hypothetical protein